VNGAFEVTPAATSPPAPPEPTQLMFHETVTDAWYALPGCPADGWS
jgi:hypothetical protein